MGHTIKMTTSDLERVKSLYYEQGKNQQEIADIYDVGQSTVGRFFKRHGLKATPLWQQRIIDPGEDVLRTDIENGLTNKDIRLKYNVSIQAVCNWMHKYGFDVNRDTVRYAAFIPEDRLRQLAEVEKKTDREIAKIFGVKFQVIHLMRKRYGIENFTNPRCPERDVLYDLYVTQELSQQQIAKRLNIGIGTVRCWLVNSGIRKRTKAETVAIGMEKGYWKTTGVKARHTRMRNSLLKGSQPQQAMVIALILGLEPLYESDWEIVIGQQNWSVLEGCKEVDIPVVAMKGDTIVKVAVEVDGIYWHTPDDHLVKDYRLRERGWKPFHFTATDKASEDQFPSMEEVVAEIRKFIVSHS